MKENNSKEGKTQGGVTRRFVGYEESSQTNTASKFASNRIFILNDLNAPRLCPALAEEIGLNESIIFLQIEFYICIGGKEKEGELWVYESIRDWASIFQFWSTATINRTILSLEKQNLIKIGNFNQKKYDKTRWFAINFEEAAKLKSVTVKGAQQGHETGSEQKETGAKQNVTASAQKATTIPETSTESLTETSFSSKELSTREYGTEFEPSPPYKGQYEEEYIEEGKCESDPFEDADSSALNSAVTPELPAAVRSATDLAPNRNGAVPSSEQSIRDQSLVPGTKGFEAQVHLRAQQTCSIAVREWLKVFEQEKNLLSGQSLSSEQLEAIASKAAYKRVRVHSVEAYLNEVESQMRQEYAARQGANQQSEASLPAKNN